MSEVRMLPEDVLRELQKEENGAHSPEGAEAFTRLARERDRVTIADLHEGKTYTLRYYPDEQGEYSLEVAEL